ncbi:MAG: hypothetical protein ACYCW6_21795 [Candidatus Xenobia bacterium]
MNSGVWLRRHFAAAVARHKTTPQADVMSALLEARVNGQGLHDEQIVNETLHFFFAVAASGCYQDFSTIATAALLTPYRKL